jgi:KDO transferase-3
MNPFIRIRKKIRRLRTPAEFAHMKTLHPYFALRQRPGPDGGYDILWRRRSLGRARPVSALERPDVADCFIVTSGPSLAQIDFRRLRGRVCFGVNGSIVKSEEAGVPFLYHMVLDRNFVRDRFELVRTAILSGSQCIFSFLALSEIGERDPGLLTGDNLFLLPQLNAIYGEPKRTPEAFDAWAADQPGLELHPAAPLQRGWVGFSRRPDLGAFSGQTVAFSALQVAWWLGYRRIFILGMDLGGAGGYARFYETGASAVKTRLDKDFEPYILPSFELAGSLCREEGREVYNVSPSSRLPADVIPTLGYDDALEPSGAIYSEGPGRPLPPG